MAPSANVVLVISTALTLCSVVVIVRGRWPNPDKDPLVYIANPIEAEMPGHWVPASIVKVILEKSSHTTYRPIVMNLPENKPTVTKKPTTTRTKRRRSILCEFYMIGYYEGCMEEDGYEPRMYWTGTFPPEFKPEYNPRTHQTKPYSTTTESTMTYHDFYHRTTTKANGKYHMNEEIGSEADNLDNESESHHHEETGRSNEGSFDNDEKENDDSKENENSESHNEDLTTDDTDDSLPATTPKQRVTRKRPKDFHPNKQF